MFARFLRTAVLAALSLALTSCASSGLAQPAAFPGAPSPFLPPLPSGPSAHVATSEEAVAIVQSALSMQGIRYEMGGDDPQNGFDCSGLVRYVFGSHHVDVPRTVDEQSHVGHKISLRDLQAGDLIFFSTVAPGASHVGIALGADQPGLFVHAPGTGGVVRIDNYDSPYWRSRVVGARRVIDGSSVVGARSAGGRVRAAW